MDFRQSIEIQKKFALVIVITGVIANTIGSIANMLLYGVVFLTIVNFASLFVIALLGGIGLATKKYLLCLYSILVVLAGIEFPITVALLGSWHVMYFLIPIVVSVFASVPVTRIIVFSWSLVVGTVAALGYNIFVSQMPFSKYASHYFGVIIAYYITAVSLFIMSSMIIDFLNKYTAENIIANTIYKGLEKVTTLDLNTGIYEYLKESDREIDRMEVRDFRELSKVMAEIGVIHPSDVANWKKVTNLEYIKRKIRESENGRYTSVAIRMKHHKAYGWYEYEFIARDDYSEKNAICVCYIRKLDNSDYAFEDSMRLLTNTFHKILRVNLTTDKYETVKLYQDETGDDQGYSSTSISKWLIDFANAGLVYEDDRVSYLEFVNRDRLRTSFAQSDAPQRLKYRRMTHGQWKWVAMELVRSIDYIEESEIILLYIRDIDDEYTSEVLHTKMMEYYCNYDSLTSIFNRFKFNNVCDEYAKNSDNGSLGVLFCDLNMLKVTNDTMGHAEGDNLIKRFVELIRNEFGDENCYRISGDEFVVLLRGVTERQFVSWAERFREFVVEKNDFISSIGFAYAQKTDKIENLVSEAEKSMYKHKQLFYDTHPKYDRRV